MSQLGAQESTPFVMKPFQHTGLASPEGDTVRTLKLPPVRFQSGTPRSGGSPSKGLAKKIVIRCLLCRELFKSMWSGQSNEIPMP